MLASCVYASFVVPLHVNCKHMKVLLINGSPRQDGNTAIALQEISKTLQTHHIQTITINIGTQPVKGCIACEACHNKDNKRQCAFLDPLYQQILDILQQGIDALIVASPTYYAGPNGSLCALLDRLFYSAGYLLAYKPAAAVAVCRRGGASATFDRLNKYFTINNMPVVPSQYWNSVHGWKKGEATQDLEGLQTMRTLANNMAWMIKNLQQEQPNKETPKIRTNFIR